jgi:hypothetical protein
VFVAVSAIACSHSNLTTIISKAILSRDWKGERKAKEKAKMRPAKSKISLPPTLLLNVLVWFFVADAAAAFRCVSIIFSSARYHGIKLTSLGYSDCSEQEGDSMSRRRMLGAVAATVLATTSLPAKHANAFDNKAYPLELQAPDAVDDIDSRARMVNEIRNQVAERALNPLIETPILSSVLWGGAVWFLSGSRSNPIATPLANVIYDVKQEKWLQDRNEGLFASLPWEFLIILSVVFVALGYGTDIVITALAEGDRTISLQLAGVSLIGGCSLELGRIASGEKKQTREESDRGSQLEAEFASFAKDRLKAGGNCHRNEVVRSFRRFYAKYRQTDSEEYPLTDLEIEQLLRAYCRPRGVEMSSAGFYSGIQINKDADVFVKQS